MSGACSIEIGEFSPSRSVKPFHLCPLWKRQLEPGPAPCHIASMAGYVVIRITERLGGGEPLRTAYAVAEPNQHRAIALFKLRPDHTADEQVEAIVELSQSALDSLGLKPGMIKPL